MSLLSFRQSAHYRISSKVSEVLVPFCAHDESFLAGISGFALFQFMYIGVDYE
jgi:hypothetical protein